MTAGPTSEEYLAAERILRSYGVWCATAAETRARAMVLARMGEFTSDEREILINLGWLR
jgi:hypothetical protein